jgi:hypothetical protein
VTDQSFGNRIAADAAAARRLAVLHVGVEAGLLRFLRAAGRPFIPAELGQKLDLDAELVDAWCRAALEVGLVIETPNGTVRAAPCLADIPLDVPGALPTGETLARIGEDVLAMPELMRARTRVAPERHGEPWLDARAKARLRLACGAARTAAAIGATPRAAAADGLRRESDLAWLRREIAAEWTLLGEPPAGTFDLLVMPGTLHDTSAALQRARVAQLRSVIAPGGLAIVVEPRDTPFFALSLAASGRSPLSPERAQSLLAAAGLVAIREVAAPSDGEWALAAEAPCGA